MNDPAPPRLSRAADDGSSPRPVRIVHVGLGNFFRAHQAWYTDRAPDADAWGIAAFTGRSADLATDLAGQDGLYTLVTRAADGDQFQVIRSLSAVHPGTDHDAWLTYARSSELAVVTITVTEAGYVLASGSGLDMADPRIVEDAERLRADLTAAVSTVPARLVAALVARQREGAGPIAVVSCDNLPHNGAITSAVVREFAEIVDPKLASVVEDMASFVTTMVDRITPRTTDTDRETVMAETSRTDTAPVVTEPFTEWVISGDFPAGRPAWERSGATIVDDVVPFEQRKLWLLNGAHSLLAYAGPIRGHETVADATADPVCRSWLEQWWDEASRHLPFQPHEVASYRSALVNRFSNPRIRHLLAQIAADGTQKIPVRILPTLSAERVAGRRPSGAARVVAAWICHLRGLGRPVNDVHADVAIAAARGELPTAVSGVLQLLHSGLAEDQPLVQLVTDLTEELAHNVGFPLG